MRYELATLAFRLPDAARARGGIEPWVLAPEAAGEFLGCWETEHGPVGRLVVLRRFEDDAELRAERERAHLSRDPFGAAGGHLTDLNMASFVPFPFSPPIQTGRHGAVYEIRDYHLRPGGLPPTLAGWEQALPGRIEIDPITVVMYAVDGPARIVHIWPFDGLDARVAVRKDLFERGLWPPPGGPQQILEATSIMAWPTAFSPLA